MSTETIIEWATDNGQPLTPKGKPTKATKAAFVEAMKANPREWGRRNGFDVGKRGRLSGKLLEAHAAAVGA